MKIFSFFVCALSAVRGIKYKESDYEYLADELLKACDVDHSNTIE